MSNIHKDMKNYKESTLFLLPLINSEDCFLNKDEIITDDFISTYIKDNRFPLLENSIVLKYKGNNDKLEKFSEINRFWGKTFDMNGLITYHITLNEKLANTDYEKILNGDYSKLSLDSKYKIADFWNLNKYSFLWGVLFKTSFSKLIYLQYLRKFGIRAPQRTKFEYWIKPNLAKETYYS